MRVGHSVLLLVVRGALSDVHQAELPTVHDKHVLSNEQRARNSATEFGSVNSATENRVAKTREESSPRPSGGPRRRHRPRRACRT